MLVILPTSGIAWSCLFEIPPIKGLFFFPKLLWTLLLGSAHHQFITGDQTTMDPVKTQHGLSSQSRSGLLGQHEQLICTVSENSARIMQHFDALSQQDTFLSTKVATLVSASATCDGVAASHTSDPEPFDGNLAKCRGFLLQCYLVFQQLSSLLRH